MFEKKDIIKNNLIFVIGIILASIFYVIGTYYFRLGENNNDNFNQIFWVSLFFGMCSYLIKIPVFHFYAKNISVMLINIFFLTTTFIFVVLYSKYILHEEIKLHTYIIICFIVGLILLNDLLNFYLDK